MANPIADVPLRVFLEGRARKLGLSPFIDGRLEIVDEPLAVTVYWADEDRERLFEDLRKQCATRVVAIVEVIRGVEHERSGAWLDRGWARKLFDACVADRPLPEDVEVWIRRVKPSRRGKKAEEWKAAEQWMRWMIKRHRVNSPAELFRRAKDAGEFAKLRPPPDDLAGAVSMMFFPERVGGYSPDAVAQHFNRILQHETAK